MDTIDVSGLPEPIAQQLQAMVQALREQLSKEKTGKPHVKLPVWQGSVKSALRREQIYDDVG
jgi:hypothetical protein